MLRRVRPERARDLSTTYRAFVEGEQRQDPLSALGHGRGVFTEVKLEPAEQREPGTVRRRRPILIRSITMLKAAHPFRFPSCRRGREGGEGSLLQELQWNSVSDQGNDAIKPTFTTRVTARAATSASATPKIRFILHLPWSVGPDGTQLLNYWSTHSVNLSSGSLDLPSVELAKRIQEERERAGLTKTALARPRYTVSYVSQIEAGRRRPSPDALAYFAERLGVTSSFLSTGVPDGLADRLRFHLEDARLVIRDGRLEEAEALAHLVRTEAERYDLDRLLAQSKLVAAQIRMLSDRVREAIDLYEEAIEGDLPEYDRGSATAALGRAYRRVGDLAYAADLIESYLSRRDDGPLDPGVAADLQTVLVSIYFERGDILRAERTARRAMSAADEDTSVEVRARTYWDASRVLAETKRWDEALELATRARMLLEQLDDRRSLARIFNATAFLCLEADPPRTEEAAGHLDRAESLLGEAGAPGDMAYVLTERSRIALLERRFEKSVRLADEALSFTGTDELEVARCLFLRGRALAELRRGRAARSTLREAATLFEKHGARQQEASCWRELGELDLAEGDLASAVEALRAGLRALDPNRSRA